MPFRYIIPECYQRQIYILQRDFNTMRGTVAENSTVSKKHNFPRFLSIFLYRIRNYMFMVQSHPYNREICLSALLYFERQNFYEKLST